MNFGVLLSVWDRLFGTHCDADAYPETGVGEACPEHAPGLSPGALARSLIDDALGPFRRQPRHERPGSGE